MNFQFQQMKSVIQQDFDNILCHYPTDLSAIDALIAAADTVWERKMVAIETAAQACDVHLFAHYPFAFELDFGERRDCPPLFINIIRFLTFHSQKSGFSMKFHGN